MGLTKIIKASIGFCFGITRAYRLMNKLAGNHGSFYTTHQNFAGEMDTLRRIERKDQHLLQLYPNLEKVTVAYDVTKLGKDDRLVLGFHGLPNYVKGVLKGKDINLLDDLQCPFIARLNKAVESLLIDGYDIVIIGKSDNHHCKEAQRLAKKYGRTCFVVEKATDIDSVTHENRMRLALVGQVTGNTITWKEVVERLHQKDIPIKILRTICSDSYLRQATAMRLAREADAVILIDDGGGASLSVFEVCSMVNRHVYRIRSKKDFRPEWLDNVHKVAIIGGILVPQWEIDEAAEYIEEISAS